MGRARPKTCKVCVLMITAMAVRQIAATKVRRSFGNGLSIRRIPVTNKGFTAAKLRVCAAKLLLLQYMTVSALSLAKGIPHRLNVSLTPASLL